MTFTVGDIGLTYFSFFDYRKKKNEIENVFLLVVTFYLKKIDCDK